MPIRSLREMLITHEGVRRKPYDDKTGRTLRPSHTLQGRLTIGVGRNLTDRGLTQSEVNYLLDNDIKKATSGAADYGWFHRLNEARQAVCISMVFNCGARGWSTFKKTHLALSEGRYEDASVELLDSRYAETVGARALHLAEILRTGQWLD